MSKELQKDNDVSMIFICECHSLEHMIELNYDSHYDSYYLNIHLHSYNFLRRLWNGIKYIFGYKCLYGDFDEFIFKKEDIEKIIAIYKKNNIE